MERATFTATVDPNEPTSPDHRNIRYSTRYWDHARSNGLSKEFAAIESETYEVRAIVRIYSRPDRATCWAAVWLFPDREAAIDTRTGLAMSKNGGDYAVEKAFAEVGVTFAEAVGGCGEYAVRAAIRGLWPHVSSRPLALIHEAHA